MDLAGGQSHPGSTPSRGSAVRILGFVCADRRRWEMDAGEENDRGGDDGPPPGPDCVSRRRVCRQQIPAQC